MPVVVFQGPTLTQDLPDGGGCPFGYAAQPVGTSFEVGAVVVARVVRRSRRTLTHAATSLAVALLLAAAMCGCTKLGVDDPPTPASAATTPLTASAPPTAGDPRRATGTSTSTTPATPRTSAAVDRRVNAVTPGGLWWGVDSSGPINAEALANVRSWYQGATPQFWGRYLSGSYAIHDEELAFAQQQHIYLYLLVLDRNCSVCDGGQDVCGSDITASQANADAQIAVQTARARHIKPGATLFKDIEQIGSCDGEPTAIYLRSWYQALKGSGYRTGFYGNAYRQNYAFPRAYCAVIATDREFATHVVLDANEPEPQLGAPLGTIGPHTAPRFAPDIPWCTPPGVVKIWQYGESTSGENYTDVDQANPDTPGMLAPDGGITGA
jgi:Domain of unknown function (DUF1906)